MPEHSHTQVYVGTCAFHRGLVWLALPHPWDALISLHATCQQGENRFQGLSVGVSALPSLSLVCMAASPMVNGVEGIAEYLPDHHYSVLSSCHTWCYHPAVDWCRRNLGGFSPHGTAWHGTAWHSTAQLNSACLCSNSVAPVLGLHCSAAVSWVLVQYNFLFPSPRLGLGWSLPTCLLS